VDENSGAATSTCIGIDIGGTFTDAVLTDGGTLWRAKSPTTPGELDRGVLEACRLVASRAGTTLEDLLPRVQRFGLGTTAVTNVLATRTGPTIGLVTTKGFEQQIPMGKGRRILRDGWVVKPDPVVPRRRIVGVAERIDRDGQIITPIDLDEVVAAARRLVDDEGVEALAVSFLWSFKHPVHEDAAVGAIRRELPDLPVFSGAALNPIMREFERTTFALLNAYVGGAFKGIDALVDELARLGLQVPVLLVHSGGGSITAAEARRVPLGLAASGPAAGVAASVSVAEAAEVGDVITCDMGGTSFDVAVIEHGHPSRRTRGEVMGVWTALPLVDVESISAGGGSIGWVDARGMLRVGPVSAGSVPGPACYGKGGTEPAVTDALVVLGYIDPSLFLGGDMELDRDAAFTACERIGARLGLDAVETAWGIRELALEGMVKAVRSLLNARGLDPRRHALVSYGGCGSLFTPDIAAAISATQVLVPEPASTLSAFGAATADIRRERLHALSLMLPAEPGALQAVAEKLAAEVLDDLAADGVRAADRSVRFETDMRFNRQAWEITVQLPSGPLSEQTFEQLSGDFRREYARRYGEGSMMLGSELELVTLRAIGIGRTVRASLDGGRRTPVAEGTPAPVHARRPVRLGRRADEERDVESHFAPDLRPGHVVTGPALVDGVDTTIWIPTNASARLDEHSTLRVEVGR
jgi:N-methylhydantoinase A